MNRHAGIIIGINHYQYFQPLSFAQQDAQQLHKYLIEEGGFSSELCVEMTETSPNIADRPTYPTRSNLGWTIDRMCRHQLQPGDVLWFFFSGYGVTWKGEDYLMPIDGKPNNIPETGIWMRSLLETLKTSAAERVFVLLDVNRATGCMNGQGMGQHTVDLARELEIPTVLSCQIDQFSRETASVELGFFTCALLDALRTGCKTLDSLEQYLSSYLPQLSEQNFRPAQNPLWVVYPPAMLKQAVLPVESSSDTMVMAPVRENSDEKIPTVSQIPSLPDDDRDLHVTPETIASNQIETSQPIPEAIAPKPTPGNEDTIAPSQPSQTETSDRAIEGEPNTSNTDRREEEESNAPTTPVTPPPKKKSKISLDDESKLWIPMVLVGVILILAGGIGLAKLHQYLEQTKPESTELEQPESETSMPENDGMTPETDSDETDPDETDPDETDSDDAESALETSISDRDANEAVIATVAEESPAPTATPTPEPSEESPAPVSDSSVPTAIPTPEPSAEESPAPVDLTPSMTQVTLPDTNRAIAIETAQASPFLAAIQKARQIRPSDPNYAQAQENIQNWSQVILDIAKVRAANGKFSEAIAAVKLVPDDAEEVYTQTEPLQGYLTAQLELKSNYQQLLDRADNSVTRGDASSYARAIATIRPIQEGQPLYGEARARVEWWSMRIWQIASDRARKGQRNLAIQTAQLVPQDSKVYSDAQNALKQWQP